MSNLKVKHIYPDGSTVIRYIPEKIYDLALSMLKKGHRYELLSELVDHPNAENIPEGTLEDHLNALDDTQLRWYAVEHGVQLLNTKDRTKIIQKILQKVTL